MVELERQIRLYIATGERVDVKVQAGISISNYFASLNILNTAAPLYGSVYLASPEALAELTALVQN